MVHTWTICSLDIIMQKRAKLSLGTVKLIQRKFLFSQTLRDAWNCLANSDRNGIEPY